MGLAQRIAGFLIRPAWKRWDRLTSNPRRTQEDFLLRVIRQNERTALGRDHCFETIKSVADYRKQVPVSDYERFRPYIERSKSGERGILTEEPVVMFNLTSGSTGDPKLIPVTRTTQRAHRDLTRLWYYRASADHSACLDGKMLGVVSPAVEGRTTGGIPFGSASGLIYRSSPAYIRNAFAVPYEVAEIKDFEAKYYVLMRLGVEQNISFFGTPNPSTIIRLAETADRFKEEIARDIRDGTLSDRFDIPSEIRARLGRRLAKNSKRAGEVETFATEHGRLRPSEYWTGLRLIACWKGGTVGARLKEFDRWFAAGTPVRDLGYMASEAQMSLPISDAGSAGILAIDANFYEFIPESEMDSANPIALTCDELAEGSFYYPVLTTPGGLYRYDINDVVRVSGFYRETPLVEFVRKGRDVTSLTGEKLHVNQVMQAFEEAQRAAGLRVKNFRALADMEQSRYVFLVEIETSTPDKERLSCLLGALEEQLHRLNIEYAQKRLSNRLAPPALWLTTQEGIDDLDHAGVHKGLRDAQFKPRLLNYMPIELPDIRLRVESR